ncbi:hypothetical protein C7974DRAFT_426199 [Boeremia exigua]|uniref:uncharacterized protein n=1 Tax=Boeremia exigua TaxID=749465 RepID=UPI001E8E57AC|nr:uncharacterized protein C7974DRAFT_426199 [Boeremia exigua]KAH6619961.1 hypothetical protein C7974DRAFT_426199 [Boeremia exigua]
MAKPAGSKHGFPVLACLDTAPLSLACTMRIRHHEARRQVTLMLRIAALGVVAGADSGHAFVAQYDADNLDLPFHTSDGAAAGHVAARAVALDASVLDIPSARLAAIERNPNASCVAVLTLRLKQPCPLWHPPLLALVPAEPRASEYNQLVDLAKATTVQIILDRNWLSREHNAPFQWIVDGQEGLSGFPVAEFYSRHFARADWTDFGPAEELHKRPRSVSGSASPLPHYKRARADEPHSPLPLPPSPTEVASSPAAPRSHNPHTYLSESDETEFQTQAIARVVSRLLPSVLPQVLPDVLDQTLPSVISQILPTALIQILPDSISPAHSFSSISHDVDTPQPSTLPAHGLTPLGEVLIPRLVAHLQPQLQTMISAALSRGVDSKLKAATLEMEETTEDRIAELLQQSDRASEELRREKDKVMDDLRHERNDGVADLRREIAAGTAALQQEGDEYVIALEADLEDRLESLQQQTDDGVLVLQTEKDDLLDDVTQAASATLTDVEQELQDMADGVVDDAEWRLREKGAQAVDAVLQQLDALREQALRAVRGEEHVKRGSARARHRGKGGFHGLGRRATTRR